MEKDRCDADLRIKQGNQVRILDNPVTVYERKCAQSQITCATGNDQYFRRKWRSPLPHGTGWSLLSGRLYLFCKGERM